MVYVVAVGVSVNVRGVQLASLVCCSEATAGMRRIKMKNWNLISMSLTAFIVLFGLSSVESSASSEKLERIAIQPELSKTLSALMQNLASQGEVLSALEEFVRSKSLIERRGRIVRTDFYKEVGSEKIRQIRLHKDDGLCYRDLKIHVEHVPIRRGGVILPPGASQPTRPIFTPELGEFDCE